MYMGMSRWGGPVQNAVFDGIRVEGTAASDLFRVKGRVERLTIRNCSLYFGSGTAANFDDATNVDIEDNHFFSVGGSKKVIKVAHMYNSRVVNNMYTFQNWSTNPTQPGPQTYLQGDRCTYSDIQVQNRQQVDVPDLAGTWIDAANNLVNKRSWYFSGEPNPGRAF